MAFLLTEIVWYPPATFFRHTFYGINQQTDLYVDTMLF